MRTLKLSLNRKAGAPNYGSDGVGMELQIEIPDDQGMSGIPEIALTYYAMLQHTIDLQLERMSARHGQPEPARQVQPTAAAPARPAEPAPPRSEPREPRRWDPDNLPPAPAREPEPAPPQTRNGNGRGKPRSGRELIGWANGQGKYDELLRLAKRADRGRIIDWDQDLVDWAYNDLSRPVGAGWGSN